MSEEDPPVVTHPPVVNREYHRAYVDGALDTMSLLIERVRGGATLTEGWLSAWRETYAAHSVKRWGE